LPRFHDGAPFRPWLLRIVANEAKNRGLAAGRQRRFALALASTGAQQTADPPETALIAAEERAWLLAHLNRLREEDRTILTLRYILELPEAEIAATLGVRRGTVKSRLHRALGRLRTQVGDRADAHPPRGADA